jgi:hypothetical protein
MYMQLKMIQVIKPILEHEISQHMSFDSLKGGDGLFRIADFGCATGINTLLVVDTIVQAVQTTCTAAYKLGLCLGQHINSQQIWGRTTIPYTINSQHIHLNLTFAAYKLTMSDYFDYMQ